MAFKPRSKGGSPEASLISWGRKQALVEDRMAKSYSKPRGPVSLEDHAHSAHVAGLARSRAKAVRADVRGAISDLRGKKETKEQRHVRTAKKRNQSGLRKILVKAHKRAGKLIKKYSYHR